MGWEMADSGVDVADHRNPVSESGPVLVLVIDRDFRGACCSFVISFFRDPEGNVPADEKVIVAPATGRIVDISTVNEPNYLKGDAIRVAIFLSVFDVHVQRSPLAGTIKAVGYQPGKFLDVRHADASALNEFRWIGIEASDGYRVTVRQIAGLIARRIVAWADEGATARQGGTVWHDQIWFPRRNLPAARHAHRGQGRRLRDRRRDHPCPTTLNRTLFPHRRRTVKTRR